MKIPLIAALLTAICYASAAANTIDPTSGLPVMPGFDRTGDHVKTYTTCSKRAREAVYMGESDVDPERAWYARTLPAALLFTTGGGGKAFFVKDGTAAVRLAGAVIVYYRFLPGLSPDQMKRFGTTTGDDACPS